KMYIDKGTYDIVKPQWVLDCVEQDMIVPLTKKWNLTLLLRYLRLMIYHVDISSMLRLNAERQMNTIRTMVMQRKMLLRAMVFWRVRLMINLLMMNRQRRKSLKLQAKSTLRWRSGSRLTTSRLQVKKTTRKPSLM